MISSSHDKENLSIQVAATLNTPGRRPLAHLQDACCSSTTPSKSLKKKLGVFSPSLARRKRKKPKRYSVPVCTLRAALDQSLASPSEVDATIEENISAVKHDEMESLHDRDVSLFVQKVVKGVVDELGKQENVEATQKNGELETIILQMNKERLQLEKQLSFALKPNKSTTPNTDDMGYKDRNGKGKRVEIELDKKTKEVEQLKQEIAQKQKSLSEISTLKHELQKSKQENKNLSGVVFCCRKENTSQKEDILRLQKEIEGQEVAFKRQYETEVERLTSELKERENECQQLRQGITQHEGEAERYHKQCQVMEGTIERLENLASAAESFKKMTEERIYSLQEQAQELDRSHQTTMIQLEEKEGLICDMREDAERLEKENSSLQAELNSLMDERDLGRLEISRQLGVIGQQEQEITNLRETVHRCQDQIEILQTQQREMNEFVEEERRGLQEVAREMECQLKITTVEKSHMDMSLKEKSLKCDVLTGEVLESRSLLHEKQEELNATQSQAHWVLLQQEAEMAETAGQLCEAWELVSAMLQTFSQQAGLKTATVPEEPRDVNGEADRSGDAAQPCGAGAAAPVSLVFSVLDARNKQHEQAHASCTADADNPPGDVAGNTSSTSIDDQEPALTISEQARELKQALERLNVIGSGEPANQEAQDEIRRLQEQRNSLEEQYESSLAKRQTELEESRTSERKLQRELERRCGQMTSLQQELAESRQQLRLAFGNLDALSEECSRRIEQEAEIKGLAADLKCAREELKSFKAENEILSEQIQEVLKKMNELNEVREPAGSDAQGTAGKMLGELMAEKLAAEKKLKQVKENSLSQRLEYEDCMTEYKYRTETKINVLESNLGKAESEICRLDDMVERIRILLQNINSDNSGIQELLRFLNGEA